MNENLKDDIRNINNNSQIKNKIEFNNNFIIGGSFFSERSDGKSFINNNAISNWDATFLNNKRKFYEGIGPKSFFGMLNNIDEYIKTILDANIKTINLSLSWSSLFIDENQVNDNMINYYKTLLSRLCDNGVQIILSFVKFDLPSWFTKKGGFLVKENYVFFERYVDLIISHFLVYSKVVYIFDNPTYMLFNTDWSDKKAIGFIGKKQETYDFIYNISLFTARTIKKIRSISKSYKIGIKQQYTPFCFQGNSNVNFNPVSKLYKYNLLANFSILDLLVKGDFKEINDLVKNQHLCINLDKNDIKEICENSLDFIGIDYKQICFLTNEKNDKPFEMFNEFIYFSKENQYHNLNFSYIREIFKLVEFKYGNIPFFLHSSYFKNDENNFRNYESNRIEDEDRIEFLINYLVNIHSFLSDPKNRCLGFLYENIFDSWDYFNAFKAKDGIFEVLNNEIYAKNSGLWYKRFCINRHFYIFIPKPSYSQEIVLETKKTKLINF